MKDVLKFDLQAFAGDADSSTAFVKVGTEYYSTLQKAIDEETGGTIEFLKDNNQTGTITGESFTFDFGTTTYTGKVTLNNGVFAVGDSALTFSGTYEVDANANNNLTYALKEFDDTDKVTGSAAFTNSGQTFTMGSNYMLTGLSTLSGSSNEWGTEEATNTYQTQITAGTKLESNSTTIVYQDASTTDLFSLAGIAKTNGIGVSNTSVTLYADNLDKKNVTLTDIVSGGYTLALGADATGTATTSATDWTYSLGTATYLTATTSTSYSTSGSTQINYNEVFNSETITAFSGVKGIGEIGINTNTNIVTLVAGVLSETNVAFTTNPNSYRFALGDGIEGSGTTAAGFTELAGGSSTYKSEGVTAGYNLDAASTTLNYTAEIAQKDLFTLSGIVSTSNITVADSLITLSTTSLGNADVNLTNGESQTYTLALVEGIDSSTLMPATYGDIESGTAKYFSAYETGGYSVTNSGTTISYTASETAQELFSLSGIISTENLTPDGSNTVTLFATNLGGSNVTLAGTTEYSLALDSGVSLAQFADAGFSYASNTATYYNASTSTGYAQVDAQTIGYYTESGGASVTSVYGVISASGLTLENTVVTVGNSALGTSEVTISEGFTLALGADVTETTNVAAHYGDVESGSAVYFGAYDTAGYKLNDSSTSISYVAQGSATELFKLTGIANVTGLEPDASNTVTLETANLSGSDVELSNIAEGANYKLALDSNVTAPETYIEGLYAQDAQSTTAAWQTTHNTEGYELDAESTTVTYTSEVKATDLIGVSDIDEFNSDLISFTSSVAATTGINVLKVKSGNDVLTLKNEAGVNVNVTQFGGDLTMASGTSIVADENWAYQDTTLHVGEEVNLTNVKGIYASTPGTDIRLEGTTLILPTGVTVQSGAEEGKTQVTGGVKIVKVGTKSYDVDSNNYLVNETVNSDVSVIQFDGSTVTLLNSEKAVIDDPKVESDTYVKVSGKQLTLISADVQTSNVTVANTSSDDIFVTNGGTGAYIVSLNEGDTMTGLGDNFTNAESWKYVGNTLTNGGGAVNLTNIAGITTDTTVKPSGDNAIISGAGVSYKGVTTSTSDGSIIAASAGVVTLNGANVTMANDASVSLADGTTDTINGNAFIAGADVNATMGTALTVEGTFTDTNISLMVDSGSIAINNATDVTLNNSAVVSSANSDVALSIATGAVVTINGVDGLSATDTKITPVVDSTASGVAFEPGTGTVALGETTFKGGKASINSGEQITLFSDASVTGAEGASYTVNKTANTAPAYINGKALMVTGGTDVYVVSTANGVSVGSEALDVTGDSTYTVTAATNDIVAVSGISNGATVEPHAGEIAILTDETGSFTIGEKTFVVSGDTSVAFGASDSVVTSITGLGTDTTTGMIVGDFASAITVNGGRVQIEGDNEVSIVGAGSGLSAIDGVGGESVNVVSAGNAPTIVTNTNGAFQFGSGQVFNVNDADGSVSFAVVSSDTLQTPSVTGVNNLENGTIAFNQDSSIGVNGVDVTLSGGLSSDAAVTLSTANSEINSVSGLFGSVNGLTSNATVSAIDSNVTVNGATIALREGDNTEFNVQVDGGTVKAVTGVNAGAAITTAQNVSVVAAEQGTYTFPNGTFNVNDTDDGRVSFVTDANSNVIDIQDFVGTLTSDRHTVTVNGAAISVSNTDASLISSGAGVGTISGLKDGDSVTAPDSTKVMMPIESNLFVNNREYALTGDEDGVIISGSSQPTVSGLDSGAVLKVTNGGTYIVNNTTLKAVNGSDIIGDPEGTAHIFESTDIDFESDTEVASIIEAVTGISETDTKQTNVATDSTIGQALNEGNTSGADGNLKVTLTNSDTDTETVQTVDFSSNTGVKNATLESGAQSLTFNNEGKNVAVVTSESKGEKNITLGNGGDLAIIEGSTDAPVNVKTGTGKDTIVSAGGNVTADLSAGGSARVMATGGNVTLNGYNAETGAGIQVTNSDIYQSVKTNIIKLGDGVVEANNAVITTNSNAAAEGSEVVNFFDLKGKKTKVGYTHSGGGSVDLSSSKEGVLLKGNYAGGASSNVLRGGDGDDSILAGANDIVDAGAGINEIEISKGAGTSGATTVRQTAESGRTTVSGFGFGFGENQDRVSITNLESAEVEYTSSGLTFTRGSAKLIVTGTNSLADLAESGDIGADGASQKVLIGEGDNLIKLEVAEKGTDISISDNSESRATAYRGSNSGMNFSNVTDNVNIDLSDSVKETFGVSTSSIGVDGVNIKGFNRFQGGSGSNTLVGADDTNNTLVAGNGSTTIYGGVGTGTDSLVGNNSSLKTGATSFFFVNNSSKDTISNFEFLASDRDNATTADKVNFMSSMIVTAQVSENNVVVELGSIEDRLTIENARGQNIQANFGGRDHIVKIDSTSLTYDGTADFFLATGKNATINVSSDVNTASIWLGNYDVVNNKESDATFQGNIRELNASGVEGKVFLAGSANDNVIVASQGDSTLWGGNSVSNDTLIGGNGHDIFWYGKGQGSDRISSVDSNDVVYLYDTTLDDIALLDVTATSIAVTDNNGGTVRVDSNNSGVSFRLADESTWTCNQTTGEWTRK